MQNFNKEKKLRASLTLPSLLQAVTTVQTGQSCNRKRLGAAVFSWPNGGTYVGEFEKKRRNGKGYFERYVWSPDFGRICKIKLCSSFKFFLFETCNIWCSANHWLCIKSRWNIYTHLCHIHNDS